MVNIEVLCTNGHRVRVTANPNTTLLQVLAEACNRKNIGPIEEFGLKHNGKALDLSIPLRYTTLTNNAKVEMCRTATGQDSTLTVALQVDGGTRKQIECSADTHLAEMLSQFSSTYPEMVDQVSQDSHEGQIPVMVYLREEIPGWFCLKNTSLKMLGLSRGRVAFRLVWRKDIDEQVSKAESELRARLSSKSQSSVSKPNPPLAVSTPSQGPPVSQAVIFGTSSIPSGSTDGPQRGFSWFNDPPVAKPPQQQPVISAFDVNPFTRALDQTVASNSSLQEFKFPDATAGQNLYQNELSDVHKQDYRPCDRQTIWYKLGAQQSVNVETDVPDSFFDVTESDLRLMMADLKRQVSAEAEAPLMTSSMRLAAKEAKYDKYSRAVIRFVFPDASVLQAVFRPRETVHALYKFMDKEIKGEMKGYYLYTAPPKAILKTKDKTLIEADMVPLSRVYVGRDTNSGENADFRLPDVSFSSTKAANEIVVDVMRPVSQRPNKVNANMQPQGSQSSPPSASTTETKTKKVPKWFKTGK